MLSSLQARLAYGNGAASHTSFGFRSPAAFVFASLFGLALLAPAAAQANTVIFNYTGSEQTFTVPAGLTRISVVAVGAPGASVGSSTGGHGAQASADLTVTPGETLYVEVGGAGGTPTSNGGPVVGGAGGFNGGGQGGGGGLILATGGGGGGGASDVRTVARSQPETLASRLITAAGAGGASPANSAGGGAAGAAGSGANPGQPGTSVSGGSAGGTGATSGSPGSGGDGAPYPGGANYDGGGGGGGLYGGGGGDANSGGGGGSSGFVAQATNTSVVADTTGTPEVIISFDGSPPQATAPVQTLTQGAQLGTSTVPVRFNWSATDNVTPSSSIKSTLQQRTGTNGVSWSGWGSLVGPTTAKTANPSFTPGTTYRQFRVKAADQSGNVGYSPLGPAFRVSAYQESNSAITYSGTWHEAGQSTAFGGGVKYSTQAGAKATLTSTGRNLAVVMPLTPTGGTAKICLDPGTTRQSCSTVDLSPASGLGARKEVFARNGLSASTTHKVQVTVVSGPVTLDGFVALR